MAARQNTIYFSCIVRRVSATAVTRTRDLRLVLVTGRYAETVALLRRGLGPPLPGAGAGPRGATRFAAGPVVIEVVRDERPGDGAAPRPDGRAGASGPPGLGLIVVACVDDGAEALRALGLGAGEAHLITNAGGVVTPDVARDVAVARRALGVRRVMVVQHEHCGLLTPGPLPAARAPSPAERMRASLALLTRPPAGLARDRVRGLLRRRDGTTVWLEPP